MLTIAMWKLETSSTHTPTDFSVKQEASCGHQKFLVNLLKLQTSISVILDFSLRENVVDVILRKSFSRILSNNNSTLFWKKSFIHLKTGLEGIYKFQYVKYFEEN